MITMLQESNGKILISPAPSPGDIELLIKQYKIRFILSLDMTAYSQTANYLNIIKNKLKKTKDANFITPQQKLIFINPSSVVSGAKEVKSFLESIQQNSRYYPMLIHCQAGKDRTGFACAKWLMINRGYSAENAIKLMETKYGYGSGGISPESKKALDEILGFQKTKESDPETIEDIDIDELMDISPADDSIVEISRGSTPNLINPNYSMTQPPASNPQQSFSVLLDLDSGYPNNSYEKTASRKRLTNKQRKNILKRLLNKPNTDNNNLSVGLRDNYDGLSSTQLNAPSGSPGAPNGASFSEPSGTVQF